MFLWVILGVALRVNVDGHPWPYLLWPFDVDLSETIYRTSYYLTADTMILSGVVFLIGHAANGRRFAAFTRWVSLWVALSTSVLMALSIPFGVIKDYQPQPWWPVSLAIWLLISYGLVLALFVVKTEHFGHCESPTCHIDYRGRCDAS